nr:uncharacterized protein LOC113813096 [Penaeus vannamei]
MEVITAFLAPILMQDILVCTLTHTQVSFLQLLPLSLKTPVVKTVAPAPVSYNVAPKPVSYNVAPFAPVAPIQSQYHAQDELGQYSFGYAGGPSSRAESRDAFGVVRGSYNYVDSEGKVQTQHYVADALGFRVSGTNLPVAPDAPVAAPLAALPGPLPEPVHDTPEVAAAKAAHQQAYDEAAAAAAAAQIPARSAPCLRLLPTVSTLPPFLIRILHSPPLRPPNSLCFSSSLHCRPSRLHHLQRRPRPHHLRRGRWTRPS